MINTGRGYQLVNIYVPSLGAPKYIKQILMCIKGKTDGNIIVVGDFNTPLTSMDRSCRQKISKATEILNDTVEQLDNCCPQGTTSPTAPCKKQKTKNPEYTFFSSVLGIG